MKSIAPAAMEAIEAGEAIVTGALEIYSRGSEPIEVPAGTDIVLTWQQTGDPFAIPDQGTMGFAYYDASDVQIGTDVLAPMINAAAGTWTTRSLSDSSPVGAVTLRLLIEIDRNAGVDATQGFDAISLTVGGELATLTNPGAETGDTTGWTTPTLGPLEVGDALTYGLAPYSGSYFFRGGDNSFIIAQQDVSLSSFVPVDPTPPVAVLRVWGGYGPIELDGETYQGIGDRGLVQQTAGAIGGVAQGLTLTLSGIEPELLTLLDADEIKGGAAVMRRLIFASDGKTLLDYDVWDRGRVDTVETEEIIGGGAAIKLGVESAARGLGKSGARQRSDSDQRLIDANDGYFKFVAYAGEKMLYWGGKRPSRIGSTSTLGGTTSFPSGAFAG